MKVKELIIKRLGNLKDKLIKIIKKQLDEYNHLIQEDCNEFYDEYLGRYIENANLLKVIEDMDLESFAELDINGRKDSLKIFILEAIEQ